MGMVGLTPVGVPGSTRRPCSSELVPYIWTRLACSGSGHRCTGRIHWPAKAAGGVTDRRSFAWQRRLFLNPSFLGAGYRTTSLHHSLAVRRQLGREKCAKHWPAAQRRANNSMLKIARTGPIGPHHRPYLIAETSATTTNSDRPTWMVDAAAGSRRRRRGSCKCGHLPTHHDPGAVRPAR